MKKRARKGHVGFSWGQVLLSAPDFADLVALLGAWRFWLAAGLAGAALGAVAHLLAPPPFRARATVNVDFHIEDAWPQNTDREQFYYLERETRKLIEIAWSDAVLTEIVRDFPEESMGELREDVLNLSQPGSGGWHFYADHADSARAAGIASTWAAAFADHVSKAVASSSSSGLEPFITVEVVQVQSIPIERIQSIAASMLAGSGILMTLGALGILFLRLAPS